MSNITTFPMSEETQTTEETQPVTAEEGITLGDFILIQNIIAVASKRGAFESKEFTVIGNLTDRLDTFIKANAPAEEKVDDGQLELPLEETEQA
jgi:hypothetical protein